MNQLSKIKQQYLQQIESAPWLAWALPVIGLLLLSYLLLAFSNYIDSEQVKLERSLARLSQLQAVSSDQEWTKRAEESSAAVATWQSQLAVMQSKTLLQAELLSNIQKIASQSGLGPIDVAIGEPTTDSLNPQYVVLDVNVRISNTNGFAFEEFWSQLLSEMPYLAITMIDVLHRGNRLQGRISAQVLALDESE